MKWSVGAGKLGEGEAHAITSRIATTGAPLGLLPVCTARPNTSPHYTNTSPHYYLASHLLDDEVLQLEREIGDAEVSRKRRRLADAPG